MTWGERKHPPPLEGDFQAVESRENGFANSQSVQTLVFYAADVRVGRWRRNALPVTNAGKSSNTSSLSDMTIAPVGYPAAKTHLPLKKKKKMNKIQLCRREPGWEGRVKVSPSKLPEKLKASNSNLSLFNLKRQPDLSQAK